jgi:hypothetical protein
MELHDKAIRLNKYSTIKMSVSSQLEAFEDYCKNKSKNKPKSPAGATYDDALTYSKSDKGKWVEFEYLDSKYRIEVIYAGSLDSAVLRTYKIEENREDIRCEIKTPILKLDIIVDKNGAFCKGSISKKAANIGFGKTATPEPSAPIANFNDEYIDFLWECVIEPKLT